LLDAPEQVLVIGVVLEYDGCALGVLVVHQQVHLVAAQGALLLLPHTEHGEGVLGRLFRQEIVDVLDNVLAHGIEVSEHACMPLPLSA